MQQGAGQMSARGTTFHPGLGLRVAFSLCFMLGAVAVACPCSAWRGDPIPLKASLETCDLLVERLGSWDNEVVAGVPGLERASVDEVYTVYHSTTQQPLYGLVPIRSGGDVVGVIAVNASGERWLWFTFGYRGAGFPRVSEEDARTRASHRALDLGLAPLSKPGVLIRGFDR